MDPERYIARQALRSGKFFQPPDTARIASASIEDPYLRPPLDDDSVRFLPKQHCGYECNVYKRRSVKCNTEYDPRAVVSLALLNWKTPILQAYANKIPLMCINASRLQYTLDAFDYGGYRATALAAENDNDTVGLALQFLIETDITQIPVSLEPNERFSQLLHTLRSSGYENYIFALARRLELDVDLAQCKQDCNVNIVFRYKRRDTESADSERKRFDAYIDPSLTALLPSIPPTVSTECRTRSSYVENREYRPRNGLITAINYEDRWFVRTTQDYIICVVT